jgi:tRNA1(Val) A37 N6-methylase TrmN6
MRKRPAGWIPPGPEVPGKAAPGPGETLDCLSGHFKIFQLRNGHRYSTDDLLTAWYLADGLTESPQSHIDLGCGIGSVALLVAWLFPETRVTGVEAQEVSAKLARKSGLYNGVEERFRVINSDFRDPSPELEGERFDSATGSPPYFLEHEGRKSVLPQRGPCRFEERGGIEGYLGAAKKYLKPGGLFAWVNITRNLGENLSEAVRAGFGEVAYRRVLFSEDAPSLITLFRGREGNGGVAAEGTPLTVRLSNGEFSQEYREIRLKMGFPA